MPHPSPTHPRSARRRVGAWILPLALALVAPVGAALPVAAASDTVALVGDLQSELGCPGDWQPECAATDLAPLASDPNLYQGSFQVPAGTWNYKVALNDSWSVNYGSGGAPGGANIPLTLDAARTVTFTFNATTHVVTDDVPRAVGAESAAQWLTKSTIALDLPESHSGWSFKLFWADQAGLSSDGTTITGGDAADLTLTGGLSSALASSYPHLAGYESLSVPASVQSQLASVLTAQLAVASYDAAGALRSVTGVQIPGVLDAVYPGARKRTLGPVWRGSKPTVSVWAPTAKNVALKLTPAGASTERTVSMRRDRDGVWSVKGDKRWLNAQYRFEVTVYAPTTQQIETNLVTDPYSLGLTTNSERSILLDLDSKALTPSGWTKLDKPRYSTQASLYETHVRDFSVSDSTVPAAHRGTYLAFTDTNSNGMKHLRALATAAGSSYVHLLPVNDISSIEEDKSLQETPDCDLTAYASSSDKQQECVSKITAKDAFNWGYDPLHYTAPEGSYSTDPSGTARNLEFRKMVAGLNGAGQRVVMDVVYNHTPSAGQDPKSILDRVVPGYYQRLTATGAVETSTCCSNTATEHAMMGKLMIDSVVTWATEYKVDGFRFDLMGHQPKATMLQLRAALDRLSLHRDGVDGKQIILYGEGWNFGEVANNARFVQATQTEMAGTGIATFNDRLRDSVRGGGPFDDDPRVQGFASGLYTDPNGDAINGTSAEQKAALLLDQDRIKVGLVGNLKGYRFVDRTGVTVTGADVDYNGAPTGYTDQPRESVNYVAAHDNETLFDALTYKLPQSTSMDDRVRMQTLALSTTAFSQGVSFWHAGTDLLRSKSFDRNSYDSGDWFNLLDFSMQENGYGRGLPIKADNESKWSYMTPLLSDAALKPSSSAIQTASARANELLQIRRSTALFDLGTASLVQQKVSFANAGPNQTPGVIVMRIDDTVGKNVDPKLKGLVVVFNAGTEPTTQQVSGVAGQKFSLHPVQAQGGDSVVKTSTFNKSAGSFTVPARTVAVFVQS